MGRFEPILRKYPEQTVRLCNHEPNHLPHPPLSVTYHSLSLSLRLTPFLWVFLLLLLTQSSQQLPKLAQMETFQA